MAIKIFRITTDDSCQAAKAVNSNFYKRANKFSGLMMRGDWEMEKFYISSPLMRAADFIDISAGSFAYGQRVISSVVGEICERSGEALEGTIENVGLVNILNVTACYNCLNRSESEMRLSPDGTVAIQIFKYSFHPERVGDSQIFKIPETRRVGIYVISGREEPPDDFIYQYKEHGFTGLIFTEVWSS